MLRIYLCRAACAGALLLTGCAGDGASAGPGNAAPQTSATSAAAFDVVAWKANWEPAKDKFASSLTTLANQLDYLTKHNASDAQLAQVLATLSKAIATAATEFVTALEAAGPIPADRSDIRTAVDKLRAALVAQAAAYQALFDCGPNPQCQNAAYSGVKAVQGTVATALSAIPAT